MNSAPKVQNNGYVDASSKERFTKNVRDLTVLYVFVIIIILGQFYICTPILIGGRYERSRTYLMHLKWEQVMRTHGNQPNSLYEVAIHTPAPYEIYLVGFRAFKSPPI